MSATAVVIGGGANGLVAAWRLASEGRRVVVCERRDRLGGLAAIDEFHPDFHAPGVLEDTTGFRPWIAEAMDLEAVGWRGRRPSAITVASPDGVFARWQGEERSGAAASEAEAFEAHSRFVREVAPAVTRLLDRPPPRLDVDGVASALALARDGWALRRLGRETLTELLRVGPMPAADWLRERFASERLIEALIAPAVLGTWLGPHSAGSAANLLALETRAGAETVGGASALVEALETACRRKGVEFELSAAASRLRLDGRSVRAVEMESGDPIDCDTVVATCDPRRAYALAPPGALPLKARERIANWRCRGTLAKVRLALDDRFEIDGHAASIVRIGTGTIDGLEQAFDAVKYRRLPDVPFLEVRQPSLENPDLAPGGGHVLSVAVGFAPLDLEGGWTDEAKATLLRTTVDRLEQVSPGASKRIVGSEVLTPIDIERRYGATGGQQHHGEHALDQLLFLRPGHRLAHYATPIDGYFLAGSGAHPGGGLTGVPGWLGAGVALEADSG